MCAESLLGTRHHQDVVVPPLSGVEDRDDVRLARNGLKQQLTGSTRCFGDEFHDGLRPILGLRCIDATEATGGQCRTKSPCVLQLDHSRGHDFTPDILQAA
jgi:hypothetical protein